MRNDDAAHVRFLAELADRGRVRRYAAGDILIREGDLAGSLFLLQEGEVRVFSVENERQVQINRHGPGVVFGEMSLDGERRSASVEAVTPVVAIEVPREAALAYLVENPAFTLNLVMTLIGRVRNATENLKAVALRDVYGRLAALLNAEAATELDGRRVVAGITQLELAQRVGASREMVSKILGDLATGGYIAKSAGRIVLLKALPKRY